MEKEVAFIRHKGYAISVKETVKDVNEKYYAHGFQFGSATTMKAAFELPQFHEYGNNKDKLITKVKGLIDNIGK